MKYDKLVPADTFLGRYLSYMQDQETPQAYDFWCGMWLLSTAVGRHTIVDRPRAPVFLNMYVLLIAESGTTRKSTSVRQAVSFIRSINDPEMMLIESRTTPEKLELNLSNHSKEYGHARCAVAVSELVTFLGSEKYNKTMPSLLTDLYDCAAIRSGGGTVTKGSVTIRNLYVSFLSASTPAWLLRAVNPDVVEGGFTSRCLFIVAEEPKRKIAWPSDARGDNTPLVVALRDIASLSRNTPTILITDGALKKYTSWYNSRPTSRDPFRSSFESREDAHVLRVAALLAINDGSWAILHNHMVAAIKLIAGVKADGAKLFEGTGNRSRVILGIERLRDCLLGLGSDTISRSKLYLKTRPHLDQAEFAAALDVMHELSLIQVFELKHEGAGRPTTLYRGTKSLAGEKSINAIVEGIEK